MVTGILSMVFTILVLFQSCAAGIVNTVEDSGDVGGTAGFLLAVLMLAGGIVEVATRKASGKGGAVAAVILFLLAAVIGFTNAKVYQDLKIWAAWCLILGVLNGITLFRGGKGKEEKKEKEKEKEI